MAGMRFNFSDAEKEAQRRIIWQYAAVAQGSTFAALLAVAAVRQLWARRCTSASTSTHRTSDASLQASRWDKINWWLGDNMYISRINIGRPDEWLLAIVCFSWLFLLSATGSIDGPQPNSPCNTGTNIANTEPFSLSRLPKDIAYFPWHRVLHLPDAQAFHISNRFGIIAASQWLLLPLLGMRRSSPLAHVLNCTHARLNRYHAVLASIMFILFMLHAIIHLVQMDSQALHSRPVVVGIGLSPLGLHFLHVAGKKYLSSRTFAIVTLAFSALLVGLVLRHAPLASVFMWHAIAMFLLSLGLQAKTTVIPSKQSSASVQAPATPPAKAPTAAPSYITLQLSTSGEQNNPLAPPKEDSAMEDGASNQAAKSVRVATIRTRNGWLVCRLADVWVRISSMLKHDTLLLQLRNPNECLTMSYTTTPTPRTGEIVPSVLFDGPLNTLTKDLRSLFLFNADQVIFIAGSTQGYLAYPAYFAYVSEQRKRRDNGDVRMIWAVRLKSGAFCAIPRRILTDGSLQDQGGTMVLSPDISLSSNGDEESGRSATARPSCLPGGEPCLHAGIDEVINGILCCKPGGSVAVVVLGPLELDGEVRKAMRPWVMRGRRVWWLFETFGM